MDAEFWHKRWTERRIGFHQKQANPILAEHWSALHLSTNTPVFVPLCGKSQDMLWLRQKGHEVIGVELSRAAIEEFDRENSLNGCWSTYEGAPVYRADSLSIWQTDIFELSTKHIGPIQAIFDRAALIALPPEMRIAYSAHLQSMAADDCQQLLLCLEYDQSKREGPPFAVFEDEVQALYPDWSLKSLAAEAIEEKQLQSLDRAYHMQLCN